MKITKQKAKKILSLLDLHIRVQLSHDYSIFGRGKNQVLTIPSEEHLIMSKEDMEIDTIQRTLIGSKLTENGIEIDYQLFGLLHEIGHLLTNNWNEFDNYIKDVEVLGALFCQEKLSTLNYVKFYNDLEFEVQADNWAMNFIKNDKRYSKVLEMWD